MTKRRKLVAIIFVALIGGAALGCHSAGSTLTSGPPRWTGNFKANRMNAELGRSAPNSGFGSITLVPVETPTRRTRIEVSINVPVPAGEHVPWAVLSGNCGSAHPMLAGPSEFPTMEVNESGNAFVQADMPFGLETNGSYHANIYWPNRSRDLNDVMMCANLSLSGR